VRTLNFTIEVDDEYVTPLENYLNNTFNLISYRVVTDTKELYNNDPVFKKLVKLEKDARVVKEKYINDNN
tara:strand:- start:1998 stop:2207 length:210 start_codon:yes stop_codon:yes gene_type:complete